MVPARLTSSRDIKATFAAGRSAACRSAVLFLRFRDDTDPARLTVVAGRKVGGAVQRNRAKRRLRAAAREVTWPQGHDAVVTARANAVSQPFPSLRADLQKLVGRAVQPASAGVA